MIYNLHANEISQGVAHEVSLDTHQAVSVVMKTRKNTFSFAFVVSTFFQGHLV